LVVATTAAFVTLPNGPYLKIKNKVIFKKEMKIKEGLELQGGARVVYEADLSKVAEADKKAQMSSLVQVFENRINKFGVSEPIVTTSKVGNQYRIIVELPGVKDSESALASIGRTAELEFKVLNAEGKEFVSSGLSGKDLKSASADFDQQGKPQINLVFTDAGAKKFEKVTGDNIGKPIATYLDGEQIQVANVQAKISGGSAVITGIKDTAEAKTIAQLLNGGKLPVPVKAIEQREVGATLGRLSLKLSLYAGIIGIIFVSLFMLSYYRFLGIFSTIGLGLYLVLMIAFVKLFNITLTMGGIAGLILSVGMSMETDVLVFERMREELRKGKNFSTALNQGFKNAWPSVRDSNAVSLIIAVLLYSAGGTIRGFAVVLILGIVVGLLTTFIGTKTFLTIAMRFKVSRHYILYAVRESEVVK
jgi:preprotein translocase subunit SecD